jgi:hypothetical protein
VILKEGTDLPGKFSTHIGQLDWRKISKASSARKNSKINYNKFIIAKEGSITFPM